MPSELEHSDDAEVIRAVLDGHSDVFELLLNRHRDHVVRIVTGRVPRERVSEIAHETFVQAYQSLGGFQARKPFRHWLSTIAVRCCYDFWRRRYRDRDVPFSFISQEGRGWVEKALSDQSKASFAEHARKREASQVLNWALDQLSPEDRMVITLTYLDEYPVAEAAELLGWSVAKVKVRAYRARRKMRKALSRLEPGG